MKKLFLFWTLMVVLVGCGGEQPIIAISFSDVSLRISDDGRLILSGKTTLPNGTKLGSMILQTVPERRGLYMDTPLDGPPGTDVIVHDGRFESWFPSAYDKGLNAGKYILQIGILPDQAELLGPGNAWLSGPGVTTEPNGQKSYQQEGEIDLPSLPAHK